VPAPAGAQVAPPRLATPSWTPCWPATTRCWTPRDDLADLLHEAELLSYRNRLGGLRCRTSCPAPSSPSSSARRWPRPGLLQQHRIKALPVVDRVQRIVGIVTRADFMRAAEASGARACGPAAGLLRPSPATHSTKPEVVGQIMSRQVRVASADRPIAGLVPLFSDTGHHHIPIVGEQARLVGILTQSDLVKALSHGP
jgi:CBS domain-containing membrane protein